MSGSTPSRPLNEPQGDDSASREATVESLLLAGLDAYFAGDLDRAIHTWTRVLFVDRGHPRARAYIERARTVMAERDRRADELVHGGVEAFESGDADRAKVLLSSAVAQGTPDALALAVLQRLERLESKPGQAAPGTTVPSALPEQAAASVPRASRVGRWLAVCAAILLVGAIALVLAWDRVDAWLVRPSVSTAASRPPDPVALPLPRVSELVLRRAQALHARGHLAEARELLLGVGLADPLRSRADQLRSEIERQLLATVETAREATGPSSRTATRP